MNLRTQLLEPMLASAMRSEPTTVVDMTGLVQQSLAKLSVSATEQPRTGEQYGLLICEADVFNRIYPFIEPGGSAIVFVRDGQHKILTRPGLELESLARTRCEEGAWVWLRRKMRLGVVAPRVSVVVVARDDEANLAQLLADLRDEPTDPSWELVVVDRGSFDATADLLDTLEGDVQRLRVPRSTDVQKALLAGLHLAHGEFLVPLDLHLRLGSGFACCLSAYADRTSGPCPAVIQGNVVSAHDAAPKLVAVHRTRVPDSARELETLLDEPIPEILPGFRATPVPLGQVRLSAKEFEKSTQPHAHAVLA